jgi:nucleoid-associated protein EbfC
MSGLNKILKQAQKMQQDLARIQEELKTKTIEVTAGGGAIKVVATCDMKILSIEIKPEAVDPQDVEMLQDLVVSGVNQALEKAHHEHEVQMAKVTAGMGMPGMGMPF